jgi:hypothetical protein
MPALLSGYGRPSNQRAARHGSPASEPFFDITVLHWQTGINPNLDLAAIRARRSTAS